MKKIIVVIATLLSLAIPFYAKADRIGSMYTFGMFATYSDAAGVGKIIGIDSTHINIQVDDAFFGCTNRQIMAILSGYDGFVPAYLCKKNELENLPLPDLPAKEDYEQSLPSLETIGQITFFVQTNVFLNVLHAPIDLKWDVPLEQLQRLENENNLSQYEFADSGQSWWFQNMNDGLVFDYLTNVIRTVRTERNWTNFYAVCRSAIGSPSGRVNDDASVDLYCLMTYASLAQLQFMQNDPLFPAVWGDELATQIERRIKYPNAPLPIWHD